MATTAFTSRLSPTTTCTNIQNEYGLDTGVTNPLYGGLPRISVFPYYIFPQELGGFNWPKVQGPDTRVQLIDHISYIRGKHAIKFGGELHRDCFQRRRLWGVERQIQIHWRRFRGRETRPGLEDFFGGAPTNATLLIGDPTRHIHNWGYAGFVQDDFKVARNVTVNFGLRYEVNTVIKEEHNLLGNFDINQGMIQAGVGGVSGPYNPDRKDFAPRFGFAWDIFGTGQTVLRAGAGIMYETVNWESFLALNNSLGLATVPTGAQIDSGRRYVRRQYRDLSRFLPGSNLFWNWTGPRVSRQQHGQLRSRDRKPLHIMGIDRNIKTPYVTTWTVNVQHSFTPNLVLEVAYVGNHGSRLVGIRDINQVNPALDDGSEQFGRPFTYNCPVSEGGAERAGHCFPYLAQVFQMGNIYRSNYDGLQTTLTSRNYHGCR